MGVGSGAEDWPSIGGNPLGIGGTTHGIPPGMRLPCDPFWRSLFRHRFSYAHQRHSYLSMQHAWVFRCVAGLSAAWARWEGHTKCVLQQQHGVQSSITHREAQLGWGAWSRWRAWAAGVSSRGAVLGSAGACRLVRVYKMVLAQWKSCAKEWGRREASWEAANQALLSQALQIWRWCAGWWAHDVLQTLMARVHAAHFALVATWGSWRHHVRDCMAVRWAVERALRLQERRHRQLMREVIAEFRYHIDITEWIENRHLLACFCWTRQQLRMGWSMWRTRASIPEGFQQPLKWHGMRR